MSGIDFDAIAAAVATRYLPAYVTPPTGQDNIAISTADLPDAITDEPTVLVFPPLDPQWNHGPMVRKANVQFPVRFYLWKVRDNARNTKLLRLWSSVLATQIDGQVHLGLSSYVTWAAVDVGPNTGKYTYGGVEYFGVEFVVGVRVWEAVAAVA